jgi:hypothetical protein
MYLRKVKSKKTYFFDILKAIDEKSRIPGSVPVPKYHGSTTLVLVIFLIFVKTSFQFGKCAAVGPSALVSTSLTFIWLAWGMSLSRTTNSLSKNTPI